MPSISIASIVVIVLELFSFDFLSMQQIFNYLDPNVDLFYTMVSYFPLDMFSNQMFISVTDDCGRCGSNHATTEDLSLRVHLTSRLAD